MAVLQSVPKSSRNIRAVRAHIVHKDIHRPFQGDQTAGDRFNVLFTLASAQVKTTRRIGTVCGRKSDVRANTGARKAQVPAQQNAHTYSQNCACQDERKKKSKFFPVQKCFR